MSLNEAIGKAGQVNVFKNDNLLNEHHPLSVKSWLEPLLQDTNIRVMELGTGKLDLFRTSDRIDTGDLLS